MESHTPEISKRYGVLGTFGTARNLPSQVVAIPMISFGMLMDSPESGFQRIWSFGVLCRDWIEVEILKPQSTVVNRQSCSSILQFAVGTVASGGMDRFG